MVPSLCPCPQAAKQHEEEEAAKQREMKKHEQVAYWTKGRPALVSLCARCLFDEYRAKCRHLSQVLTGKNMCVCVFECVVTTSAGLVGNHVSSNPPLP